MSLRKLKGKGNRGKRHHRKRWLLLAAQRAFAKPRNSTYRPRSQAARWGCINSYTRKNIRDGFDGYLEVALPEVMDFEENYDTTASHLRIIRNAAHGRFGVRKLKFDALVRISPAAALVLASEVDRWKQRIGRPLRADVGTWNPEIKRLLCEMGYFELLELTRPSPKATKSELTFLEFIRGTSEETDKGKLAQQLRINIEKIVGQKIKKTTLFRSLSEAITNVGQHAYPSIATPKKNKQWWLSASYNRSSRELTVMFYDQGVGIPSTLPKSKMYEYFKEFFSWWSDSQKIEAAMTYGRSATQLPERGKGLKDLEDFAKIYDVGRLSIYSRYGRYRMTHSIDGIETDRLDSEIPIGGTLIEWSVRLSPHEQD